METKVSVITPCYNVTPYLDQFINSILQQTWNNIELIIIDDGSTDETPALCDKWKSIVKARGIEFLYVRKENGGLASSIDAGLKVFTGDYLIWPDPDDLLDPESIRKRAEFLDNNPQYGLVRSDAAVVDESDIDKVLYRISGGLQSRFNLKIFDDLILGRTFCTSGCYMMRKSVLDDCIKDRSIYKSRTGQNWQMLLPTTLKYDVGYIDEPLYTYIIHPQSLSHAAKTYDELINLQAGCKDILDTVILTLPVDQEKYQRLVDLRFAQIKLELAITHHKKADALKEFEKLKSLGESRLRNRLLVSICDKERLLKLYFTMRKRINEYRHI